VVFTTTDNEKSDSVLWHHRFGHRNTHSLGVLKREQLVEDLNLHLPVELGVRKGCCLGKEHRFPFLKKGATRDKEQMELIHSDICGPMQTVTHKGARYFITFIDDFSRMAFVYMH
jgi:hypothetical protein